MSAARAALAVVTCGAALAAATVAPAAAIAAPPYYVALGDSLALGVQPDGGGNDRATNQGYVDVVAAGLSRAHAGLRVVKLGCGGATTGSLLGGPACRAGYGGGSQLRQAERLLRERTGSVVAVTVDVGDNDVERCVGARLGIDRGCVAEGMRAIAGRLPVIARRLRAAAGAGVPVVGIVDYDQFLALWLRGSRGRAVARASVSVIRRLNALMAGIYRRAGVRVADGGAPFRTGDLRTPRRLPGHGTVPLAVERICRWTWACSGPPIGFDDHANAAGYGVMGRTTLRALSAA